MPRGDGTGPMGMGPMSGRGAGYCAGYGMGFGRGRGWRRMSNAAGLPGSMRVGWPATPFQRPGPDTERQALKDQADALQAQLDSIRKRLSEIDGESTTP